MILTKLIRSNTKWISIFLLFITTLTLLALFIPQSQAAVFEVNSLADTNDGTCDIADCTLREAIIAANGAVGDDNITFAIGLAGPINLTGNLPAFAPGTGSITLQSNGNIVLNGAGVATVGLTINSPNNSIFGLQITGVNGNGILINNVADNTIGANVAGQRNLIYANVDSGIVIDGINATGNTISNNIIGTDAAGNPGLGNNAGITVQNGANNNLIGVVGGGNIVSGNNTSGIIVNGSNTNSISGNIVGISPIGIGALGNAANGLLINGASNNNFVNSNAIGGNGANGIQISGGANNNNIFGNSIGLDQTGNFSAAFPVGNATHGILLLGAVSNVIVSNLISANGVNGIQVANGGTTSSDNIINANAIGIDAGGNAAGNIGNGVQIAGALTTVIATNTISNNVNGVVVDGSIVKTDVLGNTISQNTVNGVTIINSTGVEISANSIVNNGALGIDLGNNGVTPNDNGTDDADVGANTLLNFPVLVSAITDGTTQTTVTGSLDTQANASFRIEFYRNAACDTFSPNFGEGEQYLGSTNVVTGANGIANFSANVAAAGGSDFVTALVVDTNGNTSEFSLCILVAPPPPVAAFIANPAIGDAPLDVFFTDQSTGLITSWFWDFGGGITSTLQNPSNNYINPGTYTVTLTVTGPGGSDTATATIFVTSPVPTATPTSTGTITATVTATPSSTPSRTLTRTSTATNTSTATLTNTATSTSTATVTASATSTTTPSATMTNTLTATATQTASVTASVTASRTMTRTATITVTPTMTTTPDMDVDKIEDDEGFDLIVGNNGGQDAQNVTVIESLRPGVRYLSSAPGSPVCIEDRGVVICELGTIAAGGSSTVDLSVSSDGTGVTSGQTQVIVGGFSAVVVDEPYIFKVGQPPVAAPGEIVTYTLRVINPTDDMVTDVFVQDVMPDALEILSAEASSGTVEIDGQNVNFTQATLNAGDRITITLETRVLETEVFESIVNRACLTSTGNSAPSCAQMSFLRAGELPSTGETPRYRLLAIVGTLLLVGGLGLAGWLVFSRTWRINSS
ncbi:MAG: PKD domain-containing protein [Aggregatilineales bacterium]